ncbi:hypothetical protein ACU635_50850 [[Actinomadura] parvosata]|uniref:hypothetical protein n=1 Tax=[Actinomadura] parvosata TaxID=1955412 RepID=UPI00406CB9F7
MPEIPEMLLRYLAARDAERDDHVNRALAALSDRERALVREAAVMGYVHGTLRGPRTEIDFPKDSAIVWQVIDACRAHPDLYPTISALTNANQEGGDA